jgi:molybdopterin molybdotransferase
MSNLRKTADMGGLAGARPIQKAVPLADALDRVLLHLSPVRDIEIVPISDARNRILAAPALAPIDLPRDDLAAMDGYAVRTIDLRPGSVVMPIIGTSVAGHPYNGRVGAGEAVRILTGAVLPAGCDRVVPQEQCDITGNNVKIDGAAIGKSNRRRRGEDVSIGETVFQTGHRLRDFDIVLAGALGIQSVQAFRQVRVGLFSSGDEVKPAGAVLERGQIWDVNRVLFASLLRALGCAVSDYGVIRDHPVIVEDALMRAARDCDLLVTTGGVSVGSEDHIRSVIGKRGVLEVWPLAIKPGKPIGFGDIDDCPIVALPGNPLAALVAFVAFARPVIAGLAGARVQLGSLMLPAGFARTKPRGVRQFLLANVVAGTDGASIIVPASRQSPSQISPLAAAQGLAVLPDDVEAVTIGKALEFVGFESLLL